VAIGPTLVSLPRRTTPASRAMCASRALGSPDGISTIASPLMIQFVRHVHHAVKGGIISTAAPGSAWKRGVDGGGSRIRKRRTYPPPRVRLNTRSAVSGSRRTIGIVLAEGLAAPPFGHNEAQYALAVQDALAVVPARWPLPLRRQAVRFDGDGGTKIDGPHFPFFPAPGVRLMLRSDYSVTPE
jgi:hypothetical protein